MLSEYLKDGVVLVIGNGINRYSNANKEYDISWEGILRKISREAKFDIGEIPKQFPFTEVFGMIISNTSSKPSDLKKIFARELKSIQYGHAHRRVIDLCEEHGTEIITTNFDCSLESVYGYTKSSISLRKGFTRYYPWQVSYVRSLGVERTARIWHLQGNIKYPDSLRLSVEDYAKSMEYFYKYNPLRKKGSYKDVETCFTSFFEKKLLIIGLALNEQEFFLRSLLFKKKKYFGNRITGWYIYCLEDTELFQNGEESSNFKRLKYFLDNVGIKMVGVSTWQELYR